MNTLPNDQRCERDIPEMAEFDKTQPGESYQEIKNRAPKEIKSWRELIEGFLTRDREKPDDENITPDDE